VTLWEILRGVEVSTRIQGLRAVAFSCRTDHAGVTLLAGGYIGVDVFFVLSGFLITGLLLSDHSEVGEFGSLTSIRGARGASCLQLLSLSWRRNVAALLLMNYLRARTAIEDSIWAALFAANIRFQQVGADYFASARLHRHSSTSGLWRSKSSSTSFGRSARALLIFAVRISRRRGRNAVSKWPVAVVLSVIVGASILWASAEPTRNRSTRISQPSLERGNLLRGLLAIGAETVAPSAEAPEAVFSWVGLIGVLLGAVWFSAATPFQGRRHTACRVYRPGHRRRDWPRL